MTVPGNLYTPTIRKTRGAGTYSVDNSAMFNKADAEYLAADSGFGTPSNADVGTLSMWFKRGNLGGSNLRLFTHGSGGSVQLQAYLTSSNTLVVGNGTEVTTTQVFRDPHAWYHLVVRVDTSQGTAADRVRLYLNGSQITSFSASSYPSQNADVFTSTGWRIGSWTGSTTHTFDGYMSEVVYCDGQSLAPTSFGETDDNGVWRPIDVSELTFGSNGFYFPFSDSGQLGADFSTGNQTSITLSGEWTGDTSDFTTLNTDIVPAGGQVGAIKTVDTFTGDFAFSFEYQAGNEIYWGVYEIDEDATFSQTSVDGGMGSMTDSFYLYTAGGGGGVVQALVGGSSESSNIFTAAAGEVIKFQRSGSTFRVYEDGVLRHTFTATSANEVRIVVGQNQSSMNWENFRWTNGSTTIGNPFLPVNSPTQSSDSPTNNAAILSPLWTDATLSNGNLKAVATGNAYQWAISSIAIPSSGKWTCEFQSSNINGSSLYGYIGIAQMGNHNNKTGTSNRWGMNLGNGEVYNGSGTEVHNFSTSSYATTLMRLEYDADADTIKIFSAGSEIFPASTGASATVGLTGQSSLHFFCAPYGSGADFTATFKGLSGTPTSGYSELNTTNLLENSTPAIEDGSAYIQSSLWSGNSSSQTVSQTGNSTFTPDWVWIKDRNFGNGGNVFDAVRAQDPSNKGLATFDGGIEDTNTDGVTFASGSIAFTGAGSTGDINNSGRTYVGWQWLAGNGTVANEVGSLSSTVSANPTAGFSIVSYTGNGGSGGAQTVGHGLGAKPNMIMIKNRSTTDSWVVYHDDVGFNAITLDTNAARITAGASVYWNDTAHTSTIFNVNTNAGVNGSGNSMIAYCFADVAGYSKFGAYIGNASSDGPFVELGFRPAFVMIKAITQVESWWIGDDVRDGYNQGNRPMLTADQQAVENNGWSGNTPYDALSNGFKIRQTDSAFNTSGGVGYLYMAFGAHPFAGTTPGTAR